MVYLHVNRLVTVKEPSQKNYKIASSMQKNLSFIIRQCPYKFHSAYQGAYNYLCLLWLLFFLKTQLEVPDDPPDRILHGRDMVIDADRFALCVEWISFGDGININVGVVCLDECQGSLRPSMKLLHREVHQLAVAVQKPVGQGEDTGGSGVDRADGGEDPHHRPLYPLD